MAALSARHALALLSTIVMVVLAACGDDESALPADPAAPETLSVTSPAFEQGAEIPVAHTCDGADVSPPLAWEGVPDEAAELALLMEDPDAPGGVFVHWVAAGIDPAADGLEEGEAPPAAGRNDFDGLGYAGPCPPVGDEAHRYVITVFAVGEPLELTEGASAGELRAALGEAVLAEGELTGRYGR